MGQSTPTCPTPLTFVSSYALNGTSGFEVNVIEPNVGYENLGTTVVQCASSGQNCDAFLSFDATATSGTQEITLTAGQEHCSLVRYEVWIDSAFIGETAELGPGQSETLSISGSGLDVSGAQPATVEIFAVGVEGGCNSGAIESWAVAILLQGIVSSSEAPRIE